MAKDPKKTGGFIAAPNSVFLSLLKGSLIDHFLIVNHGHRSTPWFNYLKLISMELQVNYPHFCVLGIASHYRNGVKVVSWIQTGFITWVEKAHWHHITICI